MPFHASDHDGVCIEDRGRLPLPPGMAVVCRALAGGGGCCAVVAIHLLMLASRRAVADFSPLLPPFRCGASSRADTGIVEKGPGPRLPPSTALGGRGVIVGCVTSSGWRSDSTHEHEFFHFSQSQRASVPPIQFLPHLSAPVSCFPPTLSLLSVVPPPKSRRCNRSRRTLRPPAGSPSLVPASLPASLPLSTTSAGQRRGILEYYGTAVPPFFLSHLSGAAGVGAVAKPTLLHAPSVQRPASCRHTCRALERPS